MAAPEPEKPTTWQGILADLFQLAPRIMLGAVLFAAGGYWVYWLYSHLPAVGQ